MPDRSAGTKRPGRGATIAANLALGLVSLGCALGVLELGLRYIAHVSQAGGADSAAAAVSADITPIYVPSATLGWTLRPDTLQEFKRRDFDTQVRSNALGFRGPQMRARPPGVERWVVLGDSYGFGWGVEEDSTYAARLAALLNQRAMADSGRAPYEVVNAALPGFGTFQRLRALETLLPYGLDGVVIEFSVSNDVVDDWRAAPYVPDHLGDYQTRGTQFTALERWGTAHSVLVRTVWERAMPLRLWMEARQDGNLRRTSALYDTLVVRARDAGLRVVILTNASRTQVLGDEGGVMGWLADSSYGRRPNRMIAEASARNHVPAVDGEAAFRGATAHELFLGRDVHWTPAGHERVAQALAPLIREADKSGKSPPADR